MARRKPTRLRVWKRKWKSPNGDPNKEAWTISYIDRHGKERRKTPFPGSKKDTDLEADKIRKQLMDKVHVGDSETVTVKQALMEFCAQERRLGRAGGTMRGMENIIDLHILPRFGKALVADLKSEDVEEMVNDLIDDGHERTPGRALGIMKRMLAYCIPRYLVRNVLVDQEVMLPAVNREPIYIPTVEEMHALLGNLEVRNNTKDDYEQHLAWYLRRLMILLPRSPACAGGRYRACIGRTSTRRPGCSRSGTVGLRQDRLKDPKTKAGIRDIPIDPAIAMALKPVWDYQGQPDRGMIVLTSRGAPAYGCMYESYFKTAMRHAGLLVPREEGGGTDRQRDRGHTPKFSIHALRHWAISSWLLDGVPIPRVARWAGHASPMVTMKVYARVIESMEQMELDRASWR